MPTDEELMHAAAGGDLDAFGQIVQRHQAAAWNAAFRFLRNAADAEDVAQEAFLRVLDAAPRYRTTAKFRTFLYRIVTRLCIDRARRARLCGVEADAVLDHRAGPVESVIRDERAAVVHKALAELPPKQRMAVILRYYENQGHREIADALETTVKGAERLLARARAALEPLLRDFLDLE